VVVQAKHYKHPVPVNFVRELIGTKKLNEADEAILMVSGVASPQARELANQNEIQILEGKDLYNT
jgi:HJR/Mrr/RecB family endonuclease